MLFLLLCFPPSVLDRWSSSRDSRLPKCNFVLHRWSPLPHETTLSINKILRASPRSLVVRFMAEQIRSSDFLGGSLCHIYSQAPGSDRAEWSTVLRFTVSAHPDANPSLHSISIGPASAAPAASFKRLYRTRAEHRVQLRALEKRASDKALTFVGTNPTGELITSGLLVIRPK